MKIRFYPYFLLWVILLTACDEQPRVQGLIPVDWGDIQVPGARLNRIAHINTYAENGDAFSYWTGGSALGDTPLDGPPDSLVGSMEFSGVRVSAYGSREKEFEISSLQLLDVAHAISTALDIWPADDTTVDVTIYLVPWDTTFQLANRVDWKQDEPFQLSLFLSADDLNSQGSEAAETAIHELYHVLANRWSIGRHSDYAMDNPHLAAMSEEAAAELYAACGVLQSRGRFTYREPRNTFSMFYEEETIDYSTPLRGADILFWLDYLETEYMPVSGPLMAETAFTTFLEKSEEVKADSSEASELLLFCEKILPEPTGLINWLQLRAETHIAENISLLN